MRNVGCVLLPILLTAAFHSTISTSLQAQPETARNRIERAVQMHQAGDVIGAIKEYNAFLNLYPNIADVRSNLGAAYVQLGRFSEAISEYRKALDLGTAADPLAIRFNLALALYKSAQILEAVSELTQLLTQKPDHFQAALILANCHLLQAEYEKIIELLAPFESSHKTDRAFAYLYGTALIHQGQVTKGQALVDLILRDGDSVQARLMLGAALMMANDIPNAAKEFQRAVDLNPNMPSVNSFYAKALREMGQIPEAIVYFNRELEVNPIDFDANLHVGIHSYKNEQRYEDALRHFEKALLVRPNAPDVRYHRALVHMLTGREDECMRMLEELVAEVPDLLEPHVTLTRLYYKRKRPEDAERHRAIVDRIRKEREADLREQEARLEKKNPQ